MVTFRQWSAGIIHYKSQVSMNEYVSDIKQVAAGAPAVYGKLSNLENLRAFLDNVPEDRIPADKLEAIKNMELTEDSITVKGGPTGSVKMTIVKREPNSLIVLKPSDLPIDLNLEIRIGEESADTSTLQVAIVADIPMMLRPMVKGPFNQLVTQFADMLAAIPYDAPATSASTDD